MPERYEHRGEHHGPGRESRAKRTIFRRTVFLMVMCGVMLFVPLFWQLWNVAIVRHEDYQQRATGQQTLDLSVSASRGNIYDRNGNELAVSATAETVFLSPKELAEELAIQILISVLKGDQNYHYENIAFICNEAGEILRLAPMIDHEFSTYFMFPDSMSRHLYWFEQLQRSIAGNEVQPDEYADFTNEEERRLMEKSATCLHGNLVYIKEHYPKVTKLFLEKLDKLEADLRENKEMFYIQKSQNYPNHANSNAYLAGKARYKEHDEEKTAIYEAKYGGSGKEIHFDIINSQIVYEVKKTIQQMKTILIS